MTHLLLASNNTHKRAEMEGIFGHLDAAVRILQPKDLGFAFDVEETADSFAGNSAAKAWGLFHLTRGALRAGVSCSVDVESVPRLVADATGTAAIPILADDSGICVRALDNRPGVHSARFGNVAGKPPLDDEGRNDLLLETLAGSSDRDAHYVCNITVVLDAERWIQVEETWHGVILEKRAPGTTGFGYDPVVWLPEYDCSVAQLPQPQKDRVSHRARAVRRAVAAAEF